MRDLGVRRFGRLGRRRRVIGLAGGGLGAGGQLVRLVRQRPATRIELEENGFARLSREPELAARRVVAVAVDRDRGSGRDVEQPVGVDEPDAVEQLEDVVGAARERAERLRARHRRLGRRRRVPVEQDVEAAETPVAGSLEQRECVADVRREKRGSTPCERRGDGLLMARLHLELADDEPLAFGRQRPRCGGDALPLSERALERGQAVARGARALGEIVALGRGSPRRRTGLVRLVLELGRARRPRARVCTRGGMLVCEARCERRRALATGPEALACRAEGHQPAVRVAGAARELAEGTVDALPLEPDRLEPRLRLDRRRPLDGRHQRMGVPRALGGLAALRGRVARRDGGLARRVLQRAERLVRSGALGTLGLRQVVPQPRGERGRRLRANGEPLPRALEPVEGADGRLASPGRVGQLDLRTLAVGEDGREPVLRRATGERGGAPPLLGLGSPLVERPEVDPRDPSMQRDDLACELLGTLRGGRLQRQRTEPLADLVLDVPRPLDLRRDPCELQLGAVPATLELPETCGLLDERPPVLGPRREDGVDLALRDDRVHRSAEPDVGEQLDEVGAPHGRAVDEVLPLAAADEAALDRDLAEVELLAEAAVLVVEDELDLAVLGGRAIAAAGEEDVVGLLGAHLRRRQRARRPDDRVRHVRLPGAVRSDHDRDPGLEGHLDGVGERLEAAQLDAPQVHARTKLSVAADGDGDPTTHGVAVAPLGRRVGSAEPHRRRLRRRTAVRLEHDLERRRRTAGRRFRERDLDDGRLACRHLDARATAGSRGAPLRRNT